MLDLIAMRSTATLSTTTFILSLTVKKPLALRANILLID